jgi:hypothetical protein
VDIVDQDLLSQISQKDARIIGGKKWEESSRGSTMEVYFMLKNPKIFEDEDPFYIPQRKLAVWGETEIPGWAGNSRLEPSLEEISPQGFWSELGQISGLIFGQISGLIFSQISGLN